MYPARLLFGFLEAFYWPIELGMIVVGGERLTASSQINSLMFPLLHCSFNIVHAEYTN